MDGILASIFLGFWSILGGKLGGKPEPRSTEKGIEKRCKKEEQRDGQKSRNENLGRLAAPRILGPGDETVEMETILLDTLLTVHICMPSCFCTQVS